MVIQAGVILLEVVYAEVFYASGRAEMLSVPMVIASLFGPIAGYEISSHKRRQRRTYSVGLSPVFTPGPGASMRVGGAALVIRVGGGKFMRAMHFVQQRAVPSMRRAHV